MSSADDISACGLTVHAHEHVASVRGRDLDLTLREFEILSSLAEHPGWVYSADQLCADDAEADYSPESVSVLVSRLRHKLVEAGAVDLIETVRGFGYRLRVPPHPAEADSADAAGSLRDSAWQLQEAVLEAEHSGSDAQRRAAAAALEEARRAIYAALAE